MADWHPHLAKDLSELANEQLESLLGYQGKEGTGHRPPRQDIAKYKQAYEEREAYRRDGATTELGKAWADRLPTKRELSLIDMYKYVFSNPSSAGRDDPKKAFDLTVDALREAPDLEDAADQLKTALKKYEQGQYPTLYSRIQNTLHDLYRTNHESYKLWPWAVKEVKRHFQANMWSKTKADGMSHGEAQHLKDIVGQTGTLLHELREEHRLPQGLDANQWNSLTDMEQWLYQYRREHGTGDDGGKTVHEFDDGWKVLQLDQPNQLEWEGDQMTHCVGGYWQQVRDGKSFIYSIRDPENKPQATLEFTPTEVGKSAEEGAPFREGADTKTAIIAQHMGEHDRMPDSDANRHIREWFDHHRGNGWNIQRNANFYYPDDWDEGREVESDDDDENPDEIGHNPGRNYRGGTSYGAKWADEQLDDWFDQYKANPNAYFKGGEDKYGLPTEPRTVNLSDEVLPGLIHQLVDDYDRDKSQIHGWESAAQRYMHAHVLADPRFGRKQQLESHIQSAEEELHEQAFDNWMYAEGECQREIQDAYRELGGKFEEEDDDDDEDEGSSWSYNVPELTPLDEDLWNEAREKLEQAHTDAYAGNAYKLTSYLYQLNEWFGDGQPTDLPAPQARNRGWPSYNKLQEGKAPPPEWKRNALQDGITNGAYAKPEDLPESERQWAQHLNWPQVNEQMPETLSAWVST